jgi:catechol 2,3-dioxygenase-like lactoylglutathione lyase family enzyme
MIGSNNIEKSRKFYNATFKALGVPEAADGPNGRLVYAHDGNRMLITKPLNGEPATGANGGTIGFKAASAEQVKAWHDAGVANGGTSVEDPPGPRENAIGKIYLAYLRDPDGNKLCASYKYPAA